MLENLFRTNNVVLYGRIDSISEEQELEVVLLLEEMYTYESLGYPEMAPDFNRSAAVWSSKVLYYAAQLVLYREHNEETITDLFTDYSGMKTPSAIITADLCLRYLPELVKYLSQIEVNDELIGVLNSILFEWHYSGLLSDIDLREVDLKDQLDDPCMSKLYINRVIEQKQKAVGQKDFLKPLVTAALGNYTNEYWKDFNEQI